MYWNIIGIFYYIILVTTKSDDLNLFNNTVPIYKFITFNCTLHFNSNNNQ